MTFPDLVPEKTFDDILKEAITEALNLFPKVTNYNPGGAFRTLLEVDAKLHEQLWVFLREVIVPNMFVVTARGKWLDAHATTFGITRKPAKKTKGYVIFRRAGEGNIKIPKGFIVQTKPTIFGEVLKFQTLEEKVLTEDLNEVKVLVEALEAGAKYNVAPHTITQTQVYLPVEVDNPEDWILEEGADEEDDESLRQRILLVWATKSLFVKDYYRYHALSVEGVVDCYIDDQHPRGQGTVDIYIVSTNGVPTDDLIQKVQAVMNEVKTPAADVLVKAPTTKYIDIELEIETVSPVDLGTLEEEIRNRLKALFVYNPTYADIICCYNDRRFRIGSKVQMATIVDVLMDLPQVKNVKVLAPPQDMELLPSELPVLGEVQINFVQ